MNRTLLLANAIALAILANSHFVPEDRAAEPVTQRMPHYLQVQKTPQWAVLSDERSATSQRISEPGVAQAPTTERLVF